MKKCMKNKKTHLILVVMAILSLLLMIFLSLKNNIETLIIGKNDSKKTINGEAQYYLAPNGGAENACKYLSDIEYDKTQSKVDWGSITPDSNLENQYNHGLITLLIADNADETKLNKRYFLKGMSAHATSTLIYDLSQYDYDYFSTYMGVDESRGTNGNGVKFYIYTQKEGEDWVLQTEQNPTAVKGNEKALYAKINVKGVKYLKLYCDKNGNNTADHAVYADAKLYNEGYEESTTEEVNFSTVEEYDNILKEKMAQQGKTIEQVINENELTLLQRTFVNNVGYDLLKAIVNLDNQYRETVEWLMNDVENLRLYVLGGEPDGGSYYNSIKELSRLYSTYKNDFTDQTPTNNTWYPNLKKGDVYKKMAISLSLTHSTKVGYWAQIDHPSNRSDSVNRYKIYKELYDGGKFVVAREVEKNADGSVTPVTPIKPILNEDGTPRQDHTPWFEALQVEEMRYVMNNITDDEELIWFNDYTQKRIDANPNQEEKYLQPHTYIAYVWPDFENPIFHDQNKQQEWDDLFEGIFSTYKVTYSTETDHVYKAWMSMRNKYGTGAVCGGISKLGAHIRAAHGTPASVVGQPGHAAIIYYRKDKAGNGYWTLDNDVSGWAQTGKSEKLGTRMPLGWGSDSYVSGYAGTYVMLSQEALNDNENYEKSEKILMTAKLYEGDLAKQEEIYREALKVQKINIDAWWGLINVYNADSNRTEEDYYKLAEELGNALMPFPLPMQNLLDQIKPKMTSVEYSFKFTLLETQLLKDGTVTENVEGKVYQPSITKTVANYLLGQTDTSLASFSFDGVDAGKITLSSRFDNTGVRWDYNLKGKDSINVKENWKEVSFNADETHKWQLTADEIASITAENDIYVHIVGTDYSEANIYKIDIEDQALLSNLYANDLENRVVGVDTNTQWRYSENDGWTSYSTNSPDLTGNKTVQVRQSPSGNKMASPASEWYTFKEDNQPDERKYIRVSDLEIAEFSTESIDKNRPFYAPCAIDGNINTRWHTDFRYNVITENKNPFITIKLNEPRYISAVEFIQTKYKVDDPDAIKNVTVYVSTDGKEWTEAGKIENCTTDKYNELKDITFEESVYGQYVKLYIDTHNMFASIAMINLFEDTTKIDRTKPTAGIYYSTKEPTSDHVIARLENPSTEITVTNNNGEDTYVFTDNGEFTFEFEDKNGNKGSATAKVDWIDKSTPTADVEYQLDGEKKLLILLDNISEDVYLLDKDDKKINYIEVNDSKKVSKMSYLDSSENIYKEAELDEKGNTTKVTYKNTTNVQNVDSYVVTYEYDENGKVTKTAEEYFDDQGAAVTISDGEKETLRTLQQVKTNPLEYTFEDSGNYEFKLLDKASNIAYKSIKVDYLEDNNIIASDISYDITKLTNKNVVATINPYMISTEGEKSDVQIANNSASKLYTFETNGEFTFKYKDPTDTEDIEVIEHNAKVDWIDKTAPTAKITYSTEQSTDQPVVATLTDESEEIIITNNNTNKERTFTSNDEFTFEFEDKAGNKGTAIAKVDWIKSTEEDPNVSDEYLIKDGYVSKVQPKTTVSEFKQNIKEVENEDENEDVIVTDKDGNVLPEDTKLTTGMIAKIGATDQYTIIITGDVNEDGEADFQDILIINKHRLDKEKIEGANLVAGDVNEDGKTDFEDILQINKYRLLKVISL